MFLYLSQEDVIKCDGLDMKMAIDDMRRLFLLHYNGATIVPHKLSLRWGDLKSESRIGRINAMPGYVGGDVNVAGIKWVSSKPDNPLKRGLPRASALIILNDPETLFPVAVMDGTLISAMRTGAVTGLAAMYLCREDASILALIGAGVQAHTQLMAVKSVRPSVREVRVFDLNLARSDAFIETERNNYPDVLFVKALSAETAVRDADIVITVTTSMEPIVKASWVKEGAFLVNAGNYEYEPDVVYKCDKVILDDWDEVVHRGIQTVAVMFKEGAFHRERCYAELGELVVGEKKGRVAENEKIFFGAVGMGVEDLIIAKRVFDKALENKIGVWLSLWDKPYWF